MSERLILGTTYPVFIGVTLVCMCGCAILMGRALARAWRPARHAVPYGVLLALAGRFLIYALFALILFLQWPLRDFVQWGSREANDLGQWIFALYVSLAVTFATREPSPPTVHCSEASTPTSARSRLKCHAPSPQFWMLMKRRRAPVFGCHRCGIWKWPTHSWSQCGGN